jgi:hypothetical protein
MECSESQNHFWNDILWDRGGQCVQYLKVRNAAGSGHSEREALGHDYYMNDIKPITGWNGPTGFRKNTPWLRRQPDQYTKDKQSAMDKPIEGAVLDMYETRKSKKSLSPRKKKEEETENADEEKEKEDNEEEQQEEQTTE